MKLPEIRSLTLTEIRFYVGVLARRAEQMDPDAAPRATRVTERDRDDPYTDAAWRAVGL